MVNFIIFIHTPDHTWNKAVHKSMECCVFGNVMMHIHILSVLLRNTHYVARSRVWLLEGNFLGQWRNCHDVDQAACVCRVYLRTKKQRLIDNSQKSFCPYTPREFYRCKTWFQVQNKRLASQKWSLLLANTANKHRYQIDQQLFATDV